MNRGAKGGEVPGGKIPSEAALEGPLGKPPFQKSAVFLNIAQKAFDPPPPFI